MFAQQSKHRTRDAALIAAALVTGASPALSQQVADLNQDRAAYLAAKCDHIKDHAIAAGCYTQESINWNRARSAAAERRGAEAEAVSNCVKFLTASVKAGTLVKDEILKKAGGKLDDANACLIARSYGYGRKAEATIPAVR